MLSSTDIQQGQRTTRGSGRYATNAIVGDQFKEVDTTNVDGAWFTRLLQHGLTGFTPFYTIAQGPYGGGGRRFQCIYANMLELQLQRCKQHLPDLPSGEVTYLKHLMGKKTYLQIIYDYLPLNIYPMDPNTVSEGT